MTDAGFTRFLIDHGLTVAGSADTIQDLKQRHGIRRWFNFQDVIDLPRASLFPEQTEPFFFLWDRNCLLPPTELECDFDYYRNEAQTHACALDRLTALFGAPEKGSSTNTLEETWKFERMSLRIRTFLPERTPARSPLYQKYPQLWNFCRISIELNWVQPLTQTDANVLDSLGQRDVHPIDRFFAPRLESLGRWERGLFRLTAGGNSLRHDAPFLWKHAGFIGWSAQPWSAFFERSRSIGLTLEQVEAARSAGYSRLILKVQNPFTLKPETDQTVLLAGPDTHTLDTAAPAVAAFWELPLNIERSDAG